MQTAIATGETRDEKLTASRRAAPPGLAPDSVAVCVTGV
jgi:hypothetical protein